VENGDEHVEGLDIEVGLLGVVVVFEVCFAVQVFGGPA